MATPEETLKSLGLGTEYSLESLEKVRLALDKMEPKLTAAREKRQKAREAQRDLTKGWDELCAARDLLQSGRASQPGDVNIGVDPVGSNGR